MTKQELTNAVELARSKEDIQDKKAAEDRFMRLWE